MSTLASRRPADDLLPITKTTPMTYHLHYRDAGPDACALIDCQESPVTHTPSGLPICDLHDALLRILKMLEEDFCADLGSIHEVKR